MKSRKFTINISSLIILASLCACMNQEKEAVLRLWYNKPAQAWEEALPLGNGHLGAMVFGNPLNEVYQLNENTLWSGYPKEMNNPETAIKLPEIRKAINEGNYAEAAGIWEKYARRSFTARYLPLADLTLNMRQLDEAANLYRDLNISDAVSTVTFEANNVKYTRTAFISYPGKVMVVRIEADGKEAVSLDVGILSQLKYNTKAIADDYLILKGKAPEFVTQRMPYPEHAVYDEQGGGMTFEVHVKLIAEGGEKSIEGDRLTIANADAVTLIISAETSFNGFNRSPATEGKDPHTIAKANIANAEGKTYSGLLKSHMEDYHKLFSRVSLNLGENTEYEESLPTDERLKRFNTGICDNGLMVLYYQFGRYLAIASSRVGGIPPNPQGLWNRHIQPPWDSNYATNINTQMNYWAVEPCGLQECHKPLLDFIQSLAVNGSKTAKVNYGIQNGWTTHHNSDIWAQTAPAGDSANEPEKSIAKWSCWPMAGVWLSRHLWEHYLYGGDKKYLKEKAYPVMKGAARFILEWLQEDSTGYLVTIPSSSPENAFKYKDREGKELIGEISKAATMDIALIWDLFTNCTLAAEELNTDRDFSELLKKTKKKLYPHQVGSGGQLLEWFMDFEDHDPRHRHLSHLYGLHPGNSINPRTSPELAAAAMKSLERRGDGGGSGWPAAWRINLWARLENGAKAYEVLRKDLKSQKSLLSTRPPLQIDGNFGNTSGITEMLLQSHGTEIFLLPALPDQWHSGEVKGLRAKGGFTIDMTWRNKRLLKVVVHSALGGNCRIRSFSPLASKTVKGKTAEGKNPNPFYKEIDSPPLIIGNNAPHPGMLRARNNNLIDFETVAGKTYELRRP